MGQAERQLDEDEQVLLELLPADGSGAASEEIRGRLGWDDERYARACVRLEERGCVQAGQGRAETVYRDLTAVPPEFRPACGRPGSRVTVRQVPVTVPHALCDLTGVTLSSPGHGGSRRLRPMRPVSSAQPRRLHVGNVVPFAPAGGPR